eukprot:Sspe_Gene.3693::Locus_1229_Transcript_1_1_Confidence_1.000_Length_6310::g.3693::m.3693
MEYAYTASADRTLPVMYADSCKGSLKHSRYSSADFLHFEEFLPTLNTRFYLTMEQVGPKALPEHIASGIVLRVEAEVLVFRTEYQPDPTSEVTTPASSIQKCCTGLEAIASYVPSLEQGTTPQVTCSECPGGWEGSYPVHAGLYCEWCQKSRAAAHGGQHVFVLAVPVCDRERSLPLDRCW